MQTVSQALKDHYAGETTTLASLWRITLINGTLKYFTNHDSDIVYLDITYESSAGYNASNVETSHALSVDNLDVKGFLLTPFVDKDQIMSGLWDFASVEIWEVNYADLSMGHRWVRKGRLGEVQQGNHMFTAELRGSKQQLQRNIGELTSATCRYDLGDTRCTKDLSGYTVTGASVISSADNFSFVSDFNSFTVNLTPSTTGTPSNDYFQGGKLTWTTGLNAGVTVEIEHNDGVTEFVTLVRDMYNPIQAGDTFTAVAGCNKILKSGVSAYTGDCKVKFGNVVNFGGEPELVGEKILQVGSR